MLRCTECAKHIYEIPSGVPQTYKGPDGKDQMIDRVDDPPCDRCPKGGPENDHLWELSEKNYRTHQLWRRWKTGLVQLPPHLETCPLMAENFAIIEETIQDARDASNSEQIAQLIALNFMRTMPHR